jgi:predicted N-acetyltransferase YhbS
VIRRATPDDTEAIGQLLETVFEDNPKTDPQVYRWQYWRNPLGPAAVVVAELDGVIVGHAAAYVAPGMLRGRPARIAHGGDAAVHPAHRGAGLFTQLSEARARAAAEEGAATMMVLPNPDALGANIRGGLEVAGRVPVWIRPLDDAWVAARTHAPLALVAAGRTAAFGALDPRDGSGAGRSDIVPRGFEQLHAQVAAQLGSGLARDLPWWRWRYAAAPSGDYRSYEVRRGGRLAGLVVVADRPRMGARFRYVFDLLAEDEAAARSVVAAALSDPHADAVVGAVMLGMAGSWAARMARACGFRRLPRALEPRPMVLGIAGTTAAHLGPWHVTWGDHDHV